MEQDFFGERYRDLLLLLLETIILSALLKGLFLPKKGYFASHNLSRCTRLLSAQKLLCQEFGMFAFTVTSKSWGQLHRLVQPELLPYQLLL